MNGALRVVGVIDIHSAVTGVGTSRGPSYPLQPLGVLRYWARVRLTSRLTQLWYQVGARGV